MKNYLLMGMFLGFFLAGKTVSSQEESPNIPLNLPHSDTNLTINHQTVTYFESARGYLAKPSDPGIYPGIVMIHEWWGLNDNIKQMADELASNGYTVLAVDLYNGEIASDPDRARELSSGIDQIKATENLRQAVQFLKTNEKATKVASLGWCFGGGQSLQLAISGEPLAATVIYYGRLTNDLDRLSVINWPILGIFGDKDASIPIDSVKTFETAIGELGQENEIYVYPGVGHAFANPTGENFAPQETQDAWKKTLAFLEKHLK